MRQALWATFPGSCHAHGIWVVFVRLGDADEDPPCSSALQRISPPFFDRSQTWVVVGASTLPITKDGGKPAKPEAVDGATRFLWFRLKETKNKTKIWAPGVPCRAPSRRAMLIRPMFVQIRGLRPPRQVFCFFVVPQSTPPKNKLPPAAPERQMIDKNMCPSPEHVLD